MPDSQLRQAIIENVNSTASQPPACHQSSWNDIATTDEGGDELQTARSAEGRHIVMVRHAFDCCHIDGRRMGDLPIDPGNHYAGLKAAIVPRG